MVFVFTLWKYFQDDPGGVHPWEAKEEVENCAEVGEQVATVVIVVGFLVGGENGEDGKNEDNHENHSNDNEDHT